MAYTKMLPSPSSLLSLYASFSTSMMLLRNLYNEIVPKQLESFVLTRLSFFFSRKKAPPSRATFIIDDSWDGLDRNQLIDAATAYLSTRIGPKEKMVRVGKFEEQNNVVTALVVGEELVDVYEDVEITWKFGKKDDNNSVDTGYFELTFEQKFRDKVFNDYLNHILKSYESMADEGRILRLYTRPSGSWRPVNLRHPFTFDTLAMDYEKKKAILDDLDRFLARKEFYKRVGKAWKRGYLLYGPPGTGKSSLIAAMANYLHFDIYVLELTHIDSDIDLRGAMLDIDNQSIVVIEDIDCYSSARKRQFSSDSDFDFDSDSNSHRRYSSRFTLSALLNCIDGLSSSRGGERIIIFTTNHKEVLDPALLRAGRMDMHIHMSHCTSQAFRILASNYLGIQEHRLFNEIDGLLESAKVSPASLAEELMKSDDPDVVLVEVLNFLKRKMEKDADEEKNKRIGEDEAEDKKEKNEEKDKNKSKNKNKMEDPEQRKDIGEEKAGKMEEDKADDEEKIRKDKAEEEEKKIHEDEAQKEQKSGIRSLEKN